ncbi:arrestin domain-containing protein 2 [Drosophila grimshawi]|uniref:arrestin domain-containing protein 2 n=1 Tax=Drosophila grimshawi TaxID=7222 RepID=UPI000C86EB0E|nr:arrestin domain-containing protein 2 [Drosophila grimshawi]
MVVTCEINLKDNPFDVYYAGQLVSGSVVLNTDKQRLVNAIVLEIKGFAWTYWTENTTDFDNKTTSNSYSGHEDYIKSKVQLLQADGENVALEPGSYVYNFACQIPSVCPSSFEGNNGRVRYMVNVKLIRPWKFDQVFSRPFTVLKVMDLNRVGLCLNTPAYSEDQKTYNCWPCRSKPLKLQLSLPQKGFVPGQIIPVGVLATNDSHIRVEEIEATLVMMVIYYSQFSVETINERFVVSRKKGEGVTRNCKKQFTLDLPVPATPPTCFDLCRIIQIAYQIEVVTKVKGWHINDRVHIPVTIGNVPLTRQLTQQPRQSPIEVEVVAQQLDEKALVLVDDVPDEARVPVTNPWAVDSSIMPPSYEEAVHVRAYGINASKSTDSQKSYNNDRETPTSTQKTFDNENCHFIPLYSVFNMVNPAENGMKEDIDHSTWI